MTCLPKVVDMPGGERFKRNGFAGMTLEPRQKKGCFGNDRAKRNSGHIAFMAGQHGRINTLPDGAVCCAPFSKRHRFRQNRWPPRRGACMFTYGFNRVSTVETTIQVRPRRTQVSTPANRPAFTNAAGAVHDSCHVTTATLAKNRTWA